MKLGVSRGRAPQVAGWFDDLVREGEGEGRLEVLVLEGGLVGGWLGAGRFGLGGWVWWRFEDVPYRGMGGNNSGAGGNRPRRYY